MNEINYETLEISLSSPTREVSELTKDEEDKIAEPGEDPRFAKPEARRPIKEGSGTYSIVHKRTGR